MLILGLDTATRATAAALLRAGPRPLEVQARDDPPVGARPRHATRLLVLVAEAMERAGVGWDAVDRIAVGVGPGTFTGLRIGIATARGLALARGIELVGVSTLASIARSALSLARSERAESVLAVLDARRGEAFAAAWKPEFLGRNEPPILKPRACSPQALASLLAELPSPTLAVGEGAVEFRKVLERAGAFIPADESELHRVSAITHCRLALSMPGGSPEQVQPEYLRVPDAEISRRASGKQ